MTLNISELDRQKVNSTTLENVQQPYHFEEWNTQSLKNLLLALFIHPDIEIKKEILICLTEFSLWFKNNPAKFFPKKENMVFDSNDFNDIKIANNLYTILNFMKSVKIEDTNEENIVNNPKYATIHKIWSQAS